MRFTTTIIFAISMAVTVSQADPSYYNYYPSYQKKTLYEEPHWFPHENRHRKPTYSKEKSFYNPYWDQPPRKNRPSSSYHPSPSHHIQYNQQKHKFTDEERIARIIAKFSDLVEEREREKQHRNGQQQPSYSQSIHKPVYYKQLPHKQPARHPFYTTPPPPPSQTVSNYYYVSRPPVPPFPYQAPAQHPSAHVGQPPAMHPTAPSQSATIMPVPANALPPNNEWLLNYFMNPYAAGTDAGPVDMSLSYGLAGPMPSTMPKVSGKEEEEEEDNDDDDDKKKKKKSNKDQEDNDDDNDNDKENDKEDDEADESDNDDDDDDNGQED